MCSQRTKRFTEQYNVLLDEAHRAMLKQLSDERRVPASQLIREWIDNAYRMRFAHEPRCVDGQNCKCPMAHTSTPTSAISTTDLLRQREQSNGL